MVTPRGLEPLLPP